MGGSVNHIHATVGGKCSLYINLSFLGPTSFLRQLSKPTFEIIPTSPNISWFTVKVLYKCDENDASIHPESERIVTYREKALYVRWRNLLFEEIILIEEKNLCGGKLRLMYDQQYGSGGHVEPFGIRWQSSKRTYNRCLFKPLWMANRVPYDHRVLHLILQLRSIISRQKESGT